jgi:hypothetical protein
MDTNVDHRSGIQGQDILIMMKFQSMAVMSLKMFTQVTLNVPILTIPMMLCQMKMKLMSKILMMTWMTDMEHVQVIIVLGPEKRGLMNIFLLTILCH